MKSNEQIEREARQATKRAEGMGDSTLSTVRQNLLTRPYYTPYCGGERCYLRWPRSAFNGSQFTCRCGWKSKYEPEFIEQYKAAQAKLTDGVPGTHEAQPRPVCKNISDCPDIQWCGRAGVCLNVPPKPGVTLPLEGQQ